MGIRAAATKQVAESFLHFRRGIIVAEVQDDLCQTTDYGRMP